MLHYDKKRRLEQLHAPVGLPRSLRLDIDEATKNLALWGTCERFMSQVIHCILCDLRNEAPTLLTKSKTWIERAIAIKEQARQFEGWSFKFHHHMYSIILWLADGTHDQASLDLWKADDLRWFAIHPDRISGADVDLSAVTFINAGAHHEFIALAAPSGIDSIKCSGTNEKQMALTLAAQALTQKFSEDKVQATVKKFLDNHVGKWLNDGHAVRASEWMKVIYWQRGEAGISPFDAVRKCLDHVEH